MTNDELEENGLVECCAHCDSLHITTEDGVGTYCNNCGIVDFVHVVSIEEWEARNTINC